MLKKGMMLMSMAAVIVSGLLSLQAGSSKAGVEEIYYATAAKQVIVGECIWDCRGVKDCIGSTSPFKDTWYNGCEEEF